MGKELILLAHNIRSAYNVGSFFRTADGAGVAKIVLSGYSARPDHQGVIKTALGAEKIVPWGSISKPGPWLKKMKRAGYTIAALEQGTGAQNIFSWRPKFPLILILGNELRGVHRTTRQQADVTLEIPMRGQKESLNVATAMGIAVYVLLK